MTIPPIGQVGLGAEFQIAPLGQEASIGPSSGPSSFAGMLGDQLGKLNELQQAAADQSQALATGQATDVSSVVAEVEQAALAMQLAVQVRNKAVDADQELFRMQV